MTSHLIQRIAADIGVPAIGRRANRRRLPILCYHGISADDDPTVDWLLVRQSRFREQMRYISKNYKCLSIDEAIEKLLADQLDSPSVCVTFDDGYRNNLTLALPILESLSIPATFYLATGFMGSGRSLWTSRLTYGLVNGLPRTLSLASFGLGTLQVGAGHSHAHRFVESLKRLEQSQRLAIVAFLDAELGPIRLPEAFAFLTWEDVNLMRRSSLVEIGAHTVNHELLSRVDHGTISSEIRASRDDILAHTGVIPKSFAFPNGRAIDFDARALRELRDSGFSTAVTTIEGLNSRDSSPLQLKRVLIGGQESLDRFRLAIAGVFGASDAALAVARSCL